MVTHPSTGQIQCCLALVPTENVSHEALDYYQLHEQIAAGHGLQLLC